MTKKVELTLWLHDATPDGAATWCKGDSFLSVFSLQGAESPEGQAALAEALEDLKGRDALFILTGSDPASEKPLLYMRAGEVAKVSGDIEGLFVGKSSPFDRLLLLGSPNAVGLYARLDSQLRASNLWSVANEKPKEARRSDASSDEWPADWTFLLKVARVTLPGFGEEGDRTATMPTAAPEKLREDVRRSSLLLCTGRGADARAKWEKNGLRILAGSRSSPLDATPSLSQPYRETVKRLVNEEKLKKIDGVWTFVEDVKLTSSVEAASILMRTSAGADNWKTPEGETLVMLTRREA